MHLLDNCSKAPAAAQIAEEYQRISGALIEAIRTQWTDEQLLNTTEIAR
ncbi:hypothetical protein U9M73_02750 [Paenibacillus phoenicis]|uniref:Uncharacterized protein n=1 Tax=Paenibacillus phoenicis TaxID=554117 RepID=A0ABU5PGG7_9BACL|nr:MULTISPECIES: hypothetical protein [Paenibacillus]MCT2194090.1 hypothetical protein [Paenibacillus sp. p3-SID1389]MEA3568917.1 hypothetical protein [Paenibacillus phoenicis]